MKKVYRCWVKCDENDFKTWHSDNLLSFVLFLDNNYPNWRFFNVYDKKKGNELARFTKSNRPLKKQL